jgi:flagellar FliJ protein
MKRFSFPLRSVAILRAHQEMRARDRFAAAVHKYVQAEESLAGARARTAAFEAALHDGQSQSYRAAEAANWLAAYRCECAAEIEAERVLFAARSEMEQRRTDYVAARRKLQAVQRLEEKARAVHRHEANRAEQAEFDDFAGRRVAGPALCAR